MGHGEPPKSVEQENKRAEVFWEEYNGGPVGDNYNLPHKG